MKRRRLKKRFYVLLFLFIVALITFAAYSFIDKKENKKIEKPIVKEEEPKEESVSLVMVGDTLIHGVVYKDAYIGNNTYDFSNIFSEIKGLVSGYDIAFYNQESIIGGKALGLSTYPRFNSPEEIGDAMVNMGFNVVSLANNHSLDKGEKGIINSMNYWKQKPDVLTSGTSLSESDRIQEQIKTKNGISYTMLAYTLRTNGLPVPSGKDYLVNVYDKDKVKADIERIRDKVDVLIISMHWGQEYTNTPVNEQTEIANYLSSLGVDIIIGHHPHVIEPIELVNNTLVFYSLGNFISGQKGVDKLTGLICSLKITKREENKEISINYSDINAHLIYTYNNNWHNYKLIPFEKLTTNELSNYESIYNKYFGILTSRNETIMVSKLR